MRTVSSPALVVLLLACSGGCLYVGGINHAPEAEVELDSQSSQLRLGGRAVLRARVSDQEDDTMVFRWRARGVDLGEQPFVVAAADGALVTQGDPPVIGSAAQLELVLPSRGRYEVELEASDPEGAVARASTSFVVGNETPNVTLELTSIDAAPAETAHPALARHIVSAARTEDDDDLSCGSAATIEWQLIHPDPDLLEIWRTVPCTGGEILDKLELRAVPGVVTQPLEVEIEATVTDPQGATGKGRLSFDLQPNRPPCLRATRPEVGEEAKVVVVSGDADEAPARFFAIDVDDDVRDQTRFRWSVADRLDAPFRLAAEDSRSFELAADRAPPGAVQLVRVRVDDPLGAEPDCPVAQRLCPRGDTGCYRWVTWEVVYR